MAANVTFVNRNDKSESFKVNLFGLEKNRVKVANVLAGFQSSVAFMDNMIMMEADEDGMSMNTFVAGSTYTLSLVRPGFGQSYQPVQLGTQRQQDFWQNLPKAKLKRVDLGKEAEEIPINQDADMEAEEDPVNQVTVTILELQDNSMFMGVEEGMSSIMVPKFYDDLWEIAERRIEERTRGVRMVITGTPGTGKSIMGWYFIYKLRMKLGFFNLVYQRNGNQTLYSKDGIVTSAPITSDCFSQVLHSGDTVYIVDGAGALVTDAMTFIFISPNPTAYNEIRKEPGTKLYYSKVWSEIDILAARQLLYKDIDESLVLELYWKWGGVPRHVLEKAKDSSWQRYLDTTIQSVSTDEWVDYLKFGCEGRTDTITHVIFHYITEDYVERSITYASRYVSEVGFSKLLKEKYARQAVVEYLQRGLAMRRI